MVAFLFSMISLHPICENLENEKKLFVVIVVSPFCFRSCLLLFCKT